MKNETISNTSFGQEMNLKKHKDMEKDQKQVVFSDAKTQKETGKHYEMEKDQKQVGAEEVKTCKPEEDPCFPFYKMQKAFASANAGAPLFEVDRAVSDLCFNKYVQSFDDPVRKVFTTCKRCLHIRNAFGRLLALVQDGKGYRLVSLLMPTPEFLVDEKSILPCHRLGVQAFYNVLYHDDNKKSLMRSLDSPRSLPDIPARRKDDNALFRDLHLSIGGCACYENRQNRQRFRAEQANVRHAQVQSPLRVADPLQCSMNAIALANKLPGGFRYLPPLEAWAQFVKCRPRDQYEAALHDAHFAWTFSGSFTARLSSGMSGWLLKTARDSRIDEKTPDSEMKSLTAQWNSMMDAHKKGKKTTDASSFEKRQIQKWGLDLSQLRRRRATLADLDEFKYPMLFSDRRPIGQMPLFPTDDNRKERTKMVSWVEAQAIIKASPPGSRLWLDVMEMEKFSGTSFTTNVHNHNHADQKTKVHVPQKDNANNNHVPKVPGGPEEPLYSCACGNRMSQKEYEQIKEAHERENDAESDEDEETDKDKKETLAPLTMEDVMQPFWWRHSFSRYCYINSKPRNLWNINGDWSLVRCIVPQPRAVIFPFQALDYTSFPNTVAWVLCLEGARDLTKTSDSALFTEDLSPALRRISKSIFAYSQSTPLEEVDGPQAAGFGFSAGDKPHEITTKFNLWIQTPDPSKCQFLYVNALFLP